MALGEKRLVQARISQTLAFGSEPFVGLGDARNARATFDGIQGAAALGIRTVRQRIAGLDLGVYLRRFVSGDFEDSPAFDHPLQRVLDFPTRDPVTGTETHSARQLASASVDHYLTVGEHYDLIIRNGDGVPINLQMMEPGTIEPVVRLGRIVGYRFLGTTQPNAMLLPSDFVRWWNPDPVDLLQSRGVISKAAVEVNTDLFVNQTWQKHFENDATPKVVLEAIDDQQAPPIGEDMEAFNLSWFRRLHRRFGKEQGSPTFIHPGWRTKELQSQMENASGVAMMTYTGQNVLHNIGVPPSITGQVVDVNRAAAETSRYTFDVNTVEPLTITRAESLTTQLASQFQQPNENVQLVVKYKPFIMRDKDFLLRQEQADIQNKIRSIDQVRDDREPALPTVTWGKFPPGTFGDTPYKGIEEDLDLSAFGLNETAEPTETPVAPEGETEGEPETPEEEERSRKRAAVSDRVRAHFAPTLEWERILRRDEVWSPRFARRERSVFGRQQEITVKRFLEQARARGVSDVDAAELFPIRGWEEMFETVVEPVRRAAFAQSADEAVKAITGEAFAFNEASRTLVQQQAIAHYAFINRTTQDKLAKVLSEALDAGSSVDQTAAEIARAFDSRKKDAVPIARTEMAAATQSAQEEGYRQSGVVDRKMWNTSLDSTVRDSHTIEGQTVELDGLFTLTDGDRGISPGAIDLDVGNRVNCRCFLTPVFIGEDAGAISFRPPGDLSADAEEF